MRRSIALLGGIACVRCAVGPDYERPAVESPPEYRIDYPRAAEVANTKWWEQFGDPALNQLIEEALLGNLDVKAAAANVDRFLGALRTTRSQFFPQFGYGADASYNRASRVGQPPLGSGDDNTYSLYQGARARTGRSTSSAACGARPRRCRRRSMRASRAGAA